MVIAARIFRNALTQTGGCWASMMFYVVLVKFMAFRIIALQRRRYCADNGAYHGKLLTVVYALLLNQLL